MELGIALAGLAGQLVQLSRECSTIIGDMSDIGNAHISLDRDLRGAGLRLKDWEEKWGLNSTSVSSGSTQQLQAPADLHLDPSNDRHRYALECLAMIVSIFDKLVQLQSDYKYEKKRKVPQDDKWYGRFLQPLRSSSRSRSKSPAMGRSPSPSTAINPPPPDANQLGPINIGLLENAEILSNPQCLQLQKEISRLNHAAKSAQNCQPQYRKLRWALGDKAKAESLVNQLSKYLDDLFTALPAPQALTAAHTHALNATNCFAIPIVPPDVSSNTDFVYRKDLVAELEQKLTGESPQHPIQVVLYGTGGMGKTHLALQYISSHHAEYSSIFFVNGASEQTTRLAYTTIMRQLIQGVATLLDQANAPVDYTNIGRQLGMAGRVNSSTGVFILNKPEDEQLFVSFF